MIRAELSITRTTVAPAALKGPNGLRADFRGTAPAPVDDGNRALFRRGEELFAEGDPADEVFTLVSGCIRLVRLLRDGRRQICAFIMPGQLAGLTVGPEYAFSAEAVDACVVIRRSRAAIEARIGSDPVFAAAMRAAAADDLHDAYDRMVLVCRRPAPARVSWFLLSMRRHTSGDTFRLPMSRADIADYLGMALETASRAFTELRKRKAIAQTSGSVVTLLDRELAEQIAESA